MEKAIHGCEWLTTDVFETVSSLKEVLTPTSQQRPPPPSPLYLLPHGLTQAQSIPLTQAFYPSTPHELILEAFEFFNPMHNQQWSLLRDLLSFNFITERSKIF
eukprot:TRINITY_DN11895_c0_g1_i1.p1 TRINITY_DN11895_c0_g1~~TRINITY_DN11895_c0_g1_i1.p1  ORF type:complete len:103 (-),score=19.80 TRINITY_DN11895_c0_g1_i1:210-518(-)